MSNEEEFQQLQLENARMQNETLKKAYKDAKRGKMGVAIARVGKFMMKTGQPTIKITPEQNMQMHFGAPKHMGIRKQTSSKEMFDAPRELVNMRSGQYPINIAGPRRRAPQRPIPIQRRRIV